MVISDAVQALDRELRDVFGARLQSLVIYGAHASAHDRAHASHDAHGHESAPTRTLAIVETLTREDLAACASRAGAWHDRGLATPLLFAAHEFDRSLDAFPLEFGAILSDYTLVSGADLFKGLAVDSSDLRRACEVQARSHLLHLREGYLETRGRADALSDLIVKSAGPFAALLVALARLEGHAAPNIGAAARHAERILAAPGAIAEVAHLADAHDLPSADAERLFTPYLDAVERLVTYVDGWSSAR
jgi:hypothetical protein